MGSKFFISFEAARLLKEKGYDIKRDFLTPVYNENGCLYWSNHEDLSDKITAITKDEAVDWLDERRLARIVLHYRPYSGTWYGEVISFRDWTSDITKDYKTRLEAKDATIIKACKLLENGN